MRKCLLEINMHHLHPLREEQVQELSVYGETRSNLLRRQQLFWFLQIPKSPCVYLNKPFSNQN